MNKSNTENVTDVLISGEVRTNIPISSEFKILTLDGGGIKGLYAAKLLSQFEKKTASNSNSVSFKMFCFMLFLICY